MFRLTREVRFAMGAPVLPGGNSYAGIPAVEGFGPYLSLRVTLNGDLDPKSGYLQNIVDIDRQVRALAIPALNRHFHAGRPPAAALQECHTLLANAWLGCELAAIELAVSPFQTFSTRATEHDMIRLSQRFEFSAAHRLHNPALSAEENVRTFGKCNNPHGHGHNYEVQVTLVGTPDASGQIFPLNEFERLVLTNAIEPLDHKHLNIEVPAFADLNPSVENIARVIYGWLKSPLARENTKLASVTVWETPKTSAEYEEP